MHTHISKYYFGLKKLDIKGIYSIIPLMQSSRTENLVYGDRSQNNHYHWWVTESIDWKNTKEC